MNAPSVPTIRDRIVRRRISWADLADSSQECSKDETHLPLPVIHDDRSYDTPAMGENSQDGLNSRLSRVTNPLETLNEAVNSGPLSFAWLLDGNSASSAAGPPGSASSSAMNASAAVFMPRMRPHPSSPSDPPVNPAEVPVQDAGQRKKQRTGRGAARKRPLSTAQEPAGAAVKRGRPREQEGRRPIRPTIGEATDQADAGPPKCEPPPWASEEDWEHRIFKRNKVVNAMKEKPEYTAYLSRRSPPDRLDTEPSTPSAEDRNLSKRRWEYEIQQWREKLKQWAADNVPRDEMQLDEFSPEVGEGEEMP